MARARVRVNRHGIRQLLRSPGVEADLMERAGRVAATARAIGRPPHSGVVDYYAKASPGRVRARAVVVADHPGALGQEAQYRTLGSALDAAG